VNSKTLFGHLALRFSSHPENLATEALAFILKNSPAASTAFIRALRTVGADVPDAVTYETQQVGVENSIPDMKCFDPTGTVRIIVENKFWAGLTDNQPTTYLRELPTGQSSVLLFIVPETRRKLVWDDLARRCEKAEIQVADVCTDTQIWISSVNDTHKLGVTSWSYILSVLASATIEERDASAHNDVVQLRGLCERMDAEAFLPLTSEELSNLEMPRRIMDLSYLPIDIVAEATKAGYCDMKNQRETSSRYGSGKYVRIGRFSTWVAFDAAAWRDLGRSPMWLQFYSDYNNLTEVRELLTPLRVSHPPMCFDFNGYVCVPLMLPTGVERNVVIRKAVEQVGRVAELLNAGAMTAAATIS
jgi:hypothetical protein